MKTPILGIVIPTKNESDNITTLLDSLLPQIPYNATVIISDDSDDDTIEKILSYNDDRIRILRGTKSNQTRNLGAKCLTSEYILFINADMDLPKNLIRNSIKTIKEHNIDLLTCKIRSKKWYIDILFRLNNLLVKLSSFKPFSIGGYFLVKNETFIDVGGFDETVLHCKDYWFTKKIDSSRFKRINSKVYAGYKRFEIMGFFGTLKYFYKNYKNRNNKKYFSR